MKSTIRCLALLSVLMLPLISRADLLIFKGTAKETYTGEGHQIKLASKVIVILDRSTTNIARIQYGSISGFKTYYTAHSTNLHFVQIIGASGKLSTAVAWLPTECEQKDTPDTEGIFLSGPNGTVTADGKAMIAFPKVLTGGGRGIFFSEQNHLPTMGESSMTVSFSQIDTVNSNNSGETPEAALSRYEAMVQSQGYISSQ